MNKLRIEYTEETNKGVMADFILIDPNGREYKLEILMGDMLAKDGDLYICPIDPDNNYGERMTVGMDTVLRTEKYDEFIKLIYDSDNFVGDYFVMHLEQSNCYIDLEEYIRDERNFEDRPIKEWKDRG